MATSRFEHRSPAPVVLLLPDFDCEGPGYWQQHWAESRIDCRAVELGQAATPDRNKHVSRLDHALRGTDAPLILVGHGIGALTIAAWAGLMSSESEVAVAGALLIAPNDPLAASRRFQVRCFPSRRWSSRARMILVLPKTVRSAWHASGGRGSPGSARAAISDRVTAWAGGPMARNCSIASSRWSSPARPARRAASTISCR